MMRILWAEDEQHIIGIAAILGETWDIQSVIACDDAVAALGAERFDLVVIDLILPITMRERETVPFEVRCQNDLEKYGGCWLIRYIRETLRVQIPIIVYTIVVGPDRDPVEKLLAGRVQGYYSKYDVFPEDLDLRIKEAVGRDVV